MVTWLVCGRTGLRGSKFCALPTESLDQRAGWSDYSNIAAGKAGWIQIDLRTTTGDGLDGLRTSFLGKEEFMKI